MKKLLFAGILSTVSLSFANEDKIKHLVGHKLNVYNLGFSYKPHPLVAIKSDYVKLDYSQNKKDENSKGSTVSLSWSWRVC